MSDASPGNEIRGQHGAARPVVSVAICTRNGESTLPSVLEALAGQIGVANSDWELLVVDNCSTDNTGAVARRFLRDCAAQVRGACVKENTPGNAAARRRAIREANGSWLVFIDDDNVPEPGFLHALLDFVRRKPHCGAVGGPSFLGPSGAAVPDWFCFLQHGFAIWDGGDEERVLRKGERRFTAGLAVSVDATRLVLTEDWHLTGRCERSLVGGEDLELCTKLERRGLELWYCPKMRFEHRLAAGRLRIGYARDLFRSFGEVHLLFSPAYYPLLGNAFLRWLVIVLTAPFKAAGLAMLLPFLSGGNWWNTLSRIWTYEGVCLGAARLVGCPCRSRGSSGRGR